MQGCVERSWPFNPNRRIIIFLQAMRGYTASRPGTAPPSPSPPARRPHPRTAESDAMQPDDPRRSPPQTAAASDATVLVDRSSAIRGHTGPGPGTVYDPRPDGTGGRSHAQPGAVAGAHVSVTPGDEERMRRDVVLRCPETVTVWRNTTSRPLSPCASQGHSDRAARRPLPTPPHRRPPPPFAARSRRPGGVRFRWLPLACPADVG